MIYVFSLFLINILYPVSEFSVTTASVAATVQLGAKTRTSYIQLYTI